MTIGQMRRAFNPMCKRSIGRDVHGALGVSAATPLAGMYLGARTL